MSPVKHSGSPHPARGSRECNRCDRLLPVSLAPHRTDRISCTASRTFKLLADRDVIRVVLSAAAAYPAEADVSVLYLAQAALEVNFDLFQKTPDLLNLATINLILTSLEIILNLF